MKKPAFVMLFFLMTIITPNLMAQQTKITHIAVYVKELKRSTDFYKNIFEFPEIEEPFKDGLHTWLNIGNNLSLHLIEAPWEPVTINKINHICFSVTDMDLIISNLKKQKVEFEDWPGNKNKITCCKIQLNVSKRYTTIAAYPPRFHQR